MWCNWEKQWHKIMLLAIILYTAEHHLIEKIMFVLFFNLKDLGTNLGPLRVFTNSKALYDLGPA